MKKGLLVFLFFLYATLVAYGTSVTGTLRDSNGTVLAFSSYTVQFVGPGNATVNGSPFPKGPFVGTTDINGQFTISLTDNTTIQPAGTQWRFTFSPPASVQSSDFLLGIAGSNQDITSSIVTVPVVVSPGTMPRAYADAEISSPMNGAFYYNLSLNTARLWANGTWGTFGGGGGGSGTVQTCSQYAVGSYQQPGSNSVIGCDPFLISNLSNLLDSHPAGISASNGFVSTSNQNGLITLNNVTNATSFFLGVAPGLGSNYGIYFPAADAAGPIRLSGIPGGDGIDQATIGLSPNDVVSGVNSQSGASYTVAATDQGYLIALTNSGNVSISLPSDTTTGFGSDWSATFEYEGSGTATITPTGGTICGLASISLNGGQSIKVYGDGTNYRCAKGAGGVSVPGSAGQLLTSNGSGGLSAATNFTCTGGNCSLGTSTSGILTVYQINSQQACTLGNGYLNLCRGDGITWAAWNGGGLFDGWGIAGDDRPHWTSAVTINGSTSNTTAFLSDVAQMISTINGDGSLINNSSSHGPTVNLTLGTAGAWTVWGRAAGTSGIPAYFQPGCGILSANSTSGTASSSTFCRGDGQWAVPAGGGNVSGTGSSTVNSVPVFNNGTTTAIIDPGALLLPNGYTWQGSLTVSSVNDLVLSSNAAYVATGGGTYNGMWIQGSPVSASSSNVGVGVNPLVIGFAPNAVNIVSGNNQTGQSVIIGGGATNGSIISNGNIVPGDVQIMVSGRLTSGTAPGNLNPAGCWGGADNVGVTGHNTLQACSSASAQANMAGLNFALSGSYNPQVGQTQYLDAWGKVTLTSNTSQTWNAGDTVCTDPTNVNKFISVGTGRCTCPSTQVGVNTTTSTGTSHITQAVFPPMACIPEVKVAGTDSTSQNVINFTVSNTGAGNPLSLSNSGGNIQYALAETGTGTKVVTSSVTSTTQGHVAIWDSNENLQDGGLTQIGVVYDSGVQTITPTATGCAVGPSAIVTPASATKYRCELHMAQTVADAGCSTHIAMGGQLQYTDAFQGFQVNPTLGTGGSTNMFSFTNTSSSVIATSITGSSTINGSQVWTPIARNIIAGASTSVNWCMNVSTAPVGCSTNATFKVQMKCYQE